MPSRSDSAQKYHTVISLLAQSAEQDNDHHLAAVLESVASAISLGLLPELASSCMKFWADHSHEKGAAPPRRKHG